MAYKGKYRVKNYKKYKGDPTSVVFRSLWEKKFMDYCDMNPNVVEWSSEEIVIPYKDPVQKKVRRYFPDFYMKVLEPNGKTQSYLVEVKPKKQTELPKKPLQRKNQKAYISEVMTYATNTAKWKSAERYCRDRLWKFKLITEVELEI